MKLFTRLFVALITVFAAAQSYAEIYTDVAATQVTLNSDTAKVKPLAATVKVGYRLSEGVAAEIEYGTNASDDSLSGGKVEIDKMTTVMLRLGGQTSYNGVRAYLLLGRSETDVKYSNVAAPGAAKLEGTTWGIGLEEFSQSVRDMSYVLEYLRYADDKNTKVTGISLGVRFYFR